MIKKTVNKSIRQLFEHQDHLTMIKRVVNKLLRSTQIVENFETHIRQSVHKHIKNVRTTHEGDVVQFHQTRNRVANSYEAGVTISHQGTNFAANKLELAGLYAKDLGYQCIRIGPTALRPVISISQSSPYTVEAAAGPASYCAFSIPCRADVDVAAGWPRWVVAAAADDDDATCCATAYSCGRAACRRAAAAAAPGCRATA